MVRETICLSELSMVVHHECVEHDEDRTQNIGNAMMN